MYLKRHARHVQKSLSAQRAGKQPTKRTLDAIENNRRWIDHYQQLLKARERDRRKAAALVLK